MLALDDDHSEFLRRFADDPLLGRATVHLRGLRPMRTATVAHALLRAVCGQLIDSKTARKLERRVIRALHSRDERHLAAPICSNRRRPPRSPRLAPFELRRLGLHERRGAPLVRALPLGSSSSGFTSFRPRPSSRRIERERGLGPWSAGVVCLEGLGRYEHGLVGDLGLVKLLRALPGREVEAWETAELLEPYGEWAGLASVYLLTGLGAADTRPPRRAA